MANAVLCLNSWAGRVERPVKIIEATAKEYIVELLEETLLPSGRRSAGDWACVPKYAVRVEDDDA